MLKTRLLFVGVLIVAALGTAALAPAFAQANEFVASKAGVIKDKQLGVHTFKTTAGTVECKTETSEGTVKEGGQKTNIEKVKYGECKAFGFLAVTISVAEFEFSSEGWATLLNKVTIEVGASCKFTLEPAKNKELKTLSYANLAGGKLEVKTAVKGFSYTSSGGVCGASGENGEYTGNSEAELAGGTIEWGAAPPPAPRLEQVDFTGNTAVLVDHQKNVTPEKAIKITEFGGADEIEWKSPKVGEVTKNWPVVYVRNTKVKLEARFALEAATREFLEKNIEGEPTITGEVMFGGAAITFTKKLTIAEIEAQLAAHKEYLTTGVIESNNALANKVRYESSTIAWKWVVKEKGRANAIEQQLGKSTHNIYTLYAATLAGTTNYLTLLDVATRGIEKEAQPPGEAEAVAGTWKGFSTVEGGVPSVHLRFYNAATGELNTAGIVMRYYFNVVAGKTLTELYKTEIEEGGRGGCPVFFVKELLEKAEGRCGAWALAFQNTLATEGIKSELIGLFVKFGAAGEPCFVVNVCTMLVKNWAFGALGAGEFPYEANEMKDAEGAAGQGIKNPSPFFWDHAIVKAGPAGAAALYDPSYGTGPFLGTEGLKEKEKPSPTSVLKEYQTKSIDGFCRPTNPATEIKPAKCQKPPAALELSPEAAFEFP
jgi:hypothetical protein